MTDFERIKEYYGTFDEWGRMDTPSGKFEMEQTLSFILPLLKSSDRILDLGGGPGRYTVALAELGYKVNLADLSEELLVEARKRIAERGLSRVESVLQLNAVDLGVFEDEAFDVVLLMGPLYHLTDENERISCVKEVYRVLKKGGLVVASYIPYLAGSIGIIDRLFNAPKQVNKENLEAVFDKGIFKNGAARGFQEGYYPKSSEIMNLFKSAGFEKTIIRSVRGFAYGREEKLFNLKEENPSMYDLTVKLINQTAEDPALIESCGHSLYAGKKP
ncbi:MAG: methyltransferase domain-containing protein [Spirochaetales bacterium]|nr:methyltransferase domain-containing protein [Spirochaetales bacterium]